jgi:hypothetical protein
MRHCSLKKRVEELSEETVQLQDDLLAGRIIVSDCDRRRREIAKKPQELEREIGSRILKLGA